MPASKVDGAIGLVTTAYGLAMAIMSYAITFEMGVMSPSGDLVTPTYLIPIVLCIVAFAIEFFAQRRAKLQAPLAASEARTS